MGSSLEERWEDPPQRGTAGKDNRGNMKVLLKAIRTALTDATLNAEVPIEDITSSYNAELANYPCIVMDIGEGSAIGIAGVSKAELEIRVFSKKSKQHLWEIYELVRNLLHSREQDITTSEVLVHAIYEAGLRDSSFDTTNRVWELWASYEILYSSTAVIATTAAAGKIYADQVDVKAVSEQEIGAFEGQFLLDVSFEERAVQWGGRRFGNSVHYNRGIAIITIEKVIFRPRTLKLLWDVDYLNSDVLADGSTAAESFTVALGTKPSYIQVLFQMTKTDDGKKLEAEADRALCETLRIPFSKKELTIHDCRWLCLCDANENILKMRVEK